MATHSYSHPCTPASSWKALQSLFIFILVFGVGFFTILVLLLVTDAEVAGAACMYQPSTIR